MVARQVHNLEVAGSNPASATHPDLLDVRLAGAFIDDDQRVRVCGARLQPFSLWHRFLLLSCGSPFLSPGRDEARIAIEDLRTALGICRLRYPYSRVRKPFVLPWKRDYLERNAAAFVVYAGGYLTRPEYSIVPPKRPAGMSPPGRRGQAPEIIHLVGELIGFTHWPEEKVWNLRVGVAYWYEYLARRARGDDVDYFTEKERAFQQELTNAK